MARVTVEDCAQVVQNRYELVLLGAQRARDISAGAMITVDRDNDKNTVIALREIADQTINLDELRRHIAKGVNRQAEMSAEDDALLALASSAFGGDAALEAANAAFSEVEYEAEEEGVEAVETASEDDAEDDLSDADIAEEVSALLDDMPELAAEAEPNLDIEEKTEEKMAAS